MRRDPGPGTGQDGFAAVDALVAVTILAMSLGLSLNAAQAGVRAQRAATETHDAELILRDRMEATLGRPGVWSGTAGKLSWRVEAAFVDSASSGRGGACVRTATVVARSGKTYRLATVDACEANRARADQTGQAGA